MEPIRRRRILQLLGCGGATLLARPAIAGGGPGGQGGLTTRLTETYGLQHPIVGAGMGFYALPELAGAISNAGALGVIGAAVQPPPILQQLIQQTRAITPGIFGVDLVNDASAPFVTDDHIAVLVEEQVPIVVFFWDPPTQAWVDTLHAAGAKVWMQVASVTGAIAARDLGVDLFIAQGAQAGGHQRGVFEGVTIPRAELVPQIIEAVAPAIVLAAGGIANGQGLADALTEGAEGAWVGTRFASSVESYAHPQYKARVLAAKWDGDAVVTTMFGPEWPDKPLRVLRDLVVDQWAGRESQIPNPPPPPAVIGNTLFAGEPYAMPKFSVILPTRDTTGDWGQMAWTAGIASAEQIFDIKTAAEIVTDMAAEAHAILAHGCGE